MTGDETHCFGNPVGGAELDRPDRPPRPTTPAVRETSGPAPFCRPGRCREGGYELATRTPSVMRPCVRGTAVEPLSG